MTWTSADGRVTEIKMMATPHIENCLSIIDERIPKLIQMRERGNQAAIELETKRKQKMEMMRVLNERYREREAKPNTCHTCTYNDKIQLEYGRMAELICRKLGYTCKTVGFSCGFWEKHNA